MKKESLIKTDIIWTKYVSTHFCVQSALRSKKKKKNSSLCIFSLKYVRLCEIVEHTYAATSYSFAVLSLKRETSIFKIYECCKLYHFLSFIKYWPLIYPRKSYRIADLKKVQLMCIQFLCSLNALKDVTGKLLIVRCVQTTKNPIWFISTHGYLTEYSKSEWKCSNMLLVTKISIAIVTNNRELVTLNSFKNIANWAENSALNLGESTPSPFFSQRLL